MQTSCTVKTNRHAKGDKSKRRNEKHKTQGWAGCHIYIIYSICPYIPFFSSKFAFLGNAGFFNKE